MGRKIATTAEISQALAMREVGYTTLSISQKLGMSVRSLHRHFSTHHTKKGMLKQDVLAKAKEELLNSLLSDDAIRSEAAKLINDDIAHANHLRSLMVEASAHLKANTLKEAMLVMRAAAAYSTAMKNTSDTLRHSLGAERIINDTTGELPELIIRELTESEVTELRLRQAEESTVCL